MKTSWNNIRDEYDGSKRKKLNETLDKSITVFEDLSNEVIYEIFEFLDHPHAFQAFYQLNQRFQNLFLYSNLPIRINISSISKLNFHRYLEDIIKSHPHRIQSLQLINPFSADMSLLLLPIMENFTRLETLIINGVESIHITEIVNHLSSLPTLTSLTIISNDNYCYLSIETTKYLRSLPIATKVFSSVEHLIIKNQVTLEQIDSLLSYVPQLRRLALHKLTESRNNRTNKSLIPLNYIRDLSLELEHIKFNDFELMIRDLFRRVEVLRIKANHTRYGNYAFEYLTAEHWEQLISTHLPNLRIFDFQYDSNSDREVIDDTTNKLNKFYGIFWTKHQWFFERHCDRTNWTVLLDLFSTNPYRRNKYVIYEGLEDNFGLNHSNRKMESVKHLYIHTLDAMKQCTINFPNATELTLSQEFDVPRNAYAIELNRIVYLQQLTKLTLGCLRCAFDQIIELLSFAPNIHTLKLDAVLLYGADSTAIQQHNLFQLVSGNNIISNLTIVQDITVEQIQIITALFSRLEFLTISLCEDTLIPIVRFLLSKTNNNTRYLSTLCVAKHRRVLYENLKLLIESENLLDDYTLKLINGKVYLWWSSSFFNKILSS